MRANKYRLGNGAPRQREQQPQPLPRHAGHHLHAGNESSRSTRGKIGALRESRAKGSCSWGMHLRAQASAPLLTPLPISARPEFIAALQSQAWRRGAHRLGGEALSTIARASTLSGRGHAAINSRRRSFLPKRDRRRLLPARKSL